MFAAKSSLRSLLLASVLIAGTCGPLLAQSNALDFGSGNADTSAPVRMKSDTLSVSQSDGAVVFSGNVLVEQGDMRIAADQIEAIYDLDGKKISSLVAIGNVTLVSGEDAAEADRAEYDLTTAEVIMTGDVLLVRGNTSVSSDRLNVDLEGGTAQMQGNVRTVLQQDE